ncbi:hypothetical protein [Aromatoleum aromaticum]|uniref:hypothetical protein n=1 Tax=Aromatoleum aromaticum TaxID=551760 RepID=UPI00059FC6CD|nr:hypothetical protein [Aromatoleum aromaticum]
MIGVQTALIVDDDESFRKAAQPIPAIGGLERMERMRQRRIDRSVIVCTGNVDVVLLLCEPRNEGFIRQIDARHRQEVLTRLADPRAARRRELHAVGRRKRLLA